MCIAICIHCMHACMDLANMYIASWLARSVLQVHEGLCSSLHGYHKMTWEH